MKASIVVTLFCMFIGSNAGPSNCPTPQWFGAQFVAIADEVFPSSLPISALDSSLSFFREVMLFSEEEIAQVLEDAFQFFNTKFGLDFSQSEPDEYGRRFYQNATLYPARFTPTIKYVVTFNSWIVSGKTRSVCFTNHIGSFRAVFSDQQMLHGTYGGEDGIPVAPGDGIIYGYIKIPVCPQEPLVLQFRSATPMRVDPHDHFGIVNADIFHRVWGHGLLRGIGRVIPTEDGHARIVIRDIYTFPAHPTYIP